MKALATLLRVHRLRLDEQGRVMQDLQALKSQIEGEIVRLENELRAEQDTARQSTVASFAFAAYSARNREQRERLKASLADIEAKIEIARSELAAIFREVKTVENVQAGLERRRLEVVQRTEQADMDAVALGMFRQRQAKSHGL